MNERLAERHATELERTLGHAGRMIAYSKSGYGRRHPDHVAVFNASVCLKRGKVWWGDLDLTRDEPKLIELARRVGQIVYVLYERDGRTEQEGKPLLERAIYSVTRDGHTRFHHHYIERAPDGTLRHRPPPPEARRRLMLTLGRPRLLRFWRLELVRKREPRHWGGERIWLLYVGARGGRTPLLVLGLSLFTGWRRGLRLEWTWYPTRKRHAPRALIHLWLVRRGNRRVQPFLRVLVHPGLDYQLICGFIIRERVP